MFIIVKSLKCKVKLYKKIEYYTQFLCFSIFTIISALHRPIPVRDLQNYRHSHAVCFCMFYNGKCLILYVCVCFILGRKCNPSLLSLVSNVSTIEPSGDSGTGQVQWWDAQGIVGLIIFLFCTLYAR